MSIVRLGVTTPLARREALRIQLLDTDCPSFGRGPAFQRPQPNAATYQLTVLWNLIGVMRESTCLALELHHKFGTLEPPSRSMMVAPLVSQLGVGHTVIRPMSSPQGSANGSSNGGALLLHDGTSSGTSAMLAGRIYSLSAGAECGQSAFVQGGGSFLTRL